MADPRRVGCLPRAQPGDGLAVRRLAGAAARRTARGRALVRADRDRARGGGRGGGLRGLRQARRRGPAPDVGQHRRAVGGRVRARRGHHLVHLRARHSRALTGRPTRASMPAESGRVVIEAADLWRPLEDRAHALRAENRRRLDGRRARAYLIDRALLALPSAVAGPLFGEGGWLGAAARAPGYFFAWEGLPGR